MKKLLVILSLLIASTAWGVTIYVDNTTTNCSTPSDTDYDPATDTCGAGSFAVYNTIIGAAAVVNPLDIVIVADGTYTDTYTPGYLLYLTRGGTVDNWITFKSENKWGAIIDGQIATNGNECITFTRYSNYIRIEDFEIKNCTIGIVSSDQPTATYGYLYRNHIHDVQLGIVLMYSSHYFTMDSNVIHGLIASLSAPEEQSYHVYIGHDTSNATIINNIFYDNQRGWLIHLYQHDDPDPQQNTKIINNTFADENPNFNGQILVATVSPNLLIENNIFYNPTTSAINAYYNNSGQNVIVRNNLTNVGSMCTDAGNGYCDYLTFANNYTSSDPLFVDVSGRNYNILFGSPAINTGFATDAPAYDIISTARPQGDYDDIGAYEYSVGVTPSEYYVSSSTGNDSNDGESITTPWRTLAKLNAATLLPGDSFYLKRGDTFYGKLKIHDSGSAELPILFSAYGAGSRPIIDTHETLTDWTPVSGGGTLTIKTADGSDTYTYEASPTTNYGTQTYFLLNTNGNSDLTKRGTIKYDFTSLTDGVTITSAFARLYYGTWDYSDPVGKSVDACRLTQAAWTEAGATWNKYDGTNNWTAPGGDYTETNKATAVIPSSANWVSWDVTTLTQYAQASTSEVLHLLFKMQTEAGNASQPNFMSSENIISNDWDPELVINYTTGSDTYKRTAILVSPANMWFDTVLGTHTANDASCPASLVDDNDWCFKTSTSELYIFSATNPSGRTIVRDSTYGVDFNAKNYITVENVEAKNSGTANVNMTGTNGILRQSKIHDSADDNVIVNGNANTVYYNLIYDAIADGISIEGGTALGIYNNVIYSNGDEGTFITGTAAGTMKNNISTDNTGSSIEIDAGVGAWTINYNDYMPSTGTPFDFEGTGYNFTDWKTACQAVHTNCDANSQNVTPLFLAAPSNFHLTTASTLINAGTTISGLIKDYDNITLWAGPAIDIGAFEMAYSQTSNAMLFGMEF